MTPEQMDEARRWVALRGWRWMPGMRAVTPMADFAGRLTEATLGIARPVYPDLNDPATRGCLLALAREITGRADLSTVWISPADVWCSWWSARRRNTFGEARSAETAALLKAVEDYYRALAREEGA